MVTIPQCRSTVNDMSRQHDSQLFEDLVPAHSDRDNQVWADKTLSRRGWRPRICQKAGQAVECPAGKFQPAVFERSVPGRACVRFDDQRDAGAAHALHRQGADLGRASQSLRQIEAVDRSDAVVCRRHRRKLRPDRHNQDRTDRKDGFWVLRWEKIGFDMRIFEIKWSKSGIVFENQHLALSCAQFSR